MIKKFNEFNEGIGTWVRSKFNSDEMTAKGILNKIKLLKPEDIVSLDDEDMMDRVLNTNYSYNIDGFNIESRKEFSPMGGLWDSKICSIYVDSVKLNVSEHLSRKIFNLVEKIYNSNKKESQEGKSDEDYIRKDAKIHFSK